jgi:large subunit ribosomal protein L24
LSQSLCIDSNMAAVSGVGLGGLRGRPAPAALRPTAPSRCVQAHGVIGPGKKWEHYALNKNGNPIRPPLHVMTGDTVVVIAGDDRGKVGKVEKVFTKTSEILMEGINLSMRHKASQMQGEQGERVKKESPISASNVMHWSEAKQVRSRIGHKIVDGKKVRFLKKTGEVLEKKTGKVPEK